MPSYEAALIFKVLKRPQMTQAVKRAAAHILENEGMIHSFEYLGQRTLPYRMFAHGERHKEGSYFMIGFDSKSEFLPLLRDHCRRDSEIIRPRILRKEIELARPCDNKQCEFGELTEELRRQLVIDRNTHIKKL